MTDERVPMDVEALVNRATSGACFICEFLAGNADYHHETVAERDDAVVFLNKFPTQFGALLVAPRSHLEQVTGDFSRAAYLELQGLIHDVAEAVRGVLQPERVYILSLGSQAANSHVHWHIVPLVAGLPLNEQQFFALMHENGVVVPDEARTEAYVAALRTHLAR